MRSPPGGGRGPACSSTRKCRNSDMTAQARQPLSAWPPFNVDSGTYRGNRKIGVAESDFSMPLPWSPSSCRLFAMAGAAG